MSDDQIAQLTKSITDQIDFRFSSLGQRFDKIDKRLDGIEGRVATIEHKISALETSQTKAVGAVIEAQQTFVTRTEQMATKADINRVIDLLDRDQREHERQEQEHLVLAAQLERHITTRGAQAHA